jgi:hypothetical protein
MPETMRITSVKFACPKCKRPLRSVENALQCDVCNQTYLIVGGIPDFVPEEVLTGVAPNYRLIKMLEFL